MENARHKDGTTRDSPLDGRFADKMNRAGRPARRCAAPRDAERRLVAQAASSTAPSRLEERPCSVR